MKKLFLLLILFCCFSFAQGKDPDVILDNVKQNFDRVQDYEVNVKIKVDVDFLKVPETEAIIFFKQPDKIQFHSESFALLPKEGLNFSPLSILKGEYTAIYDREDTIDGKKTSVVKVIPLGEGGNIILSTLWIDQSANVIRKIESTTKAAGTFSINLKYDKSVNNYPLPASMIFSFNVDKMKIPKGFSGDMGSEEKNKNDDKPTKGKVYITYSNYKVNKGIPDEIFKKKKE
jgi:outer membrane lipoprotein-sorting protein